MNNQMQFLAPLFVLAQWIIPCTQHTFLHMILELLICLYDKATQEGLLHRTSDEDHLRGAATTIYKLEFKRGNSDTNNLPYSVSKLDTSRQDDRATQVGLLHRTGNEDHLREAITTIYKLEFERGNSS